MIRFKFDESIDNGHKSFEKGGKLGSFYGDFNSAFDRICHRLLIAKIPKLILNDLEITVMVKKNYQVLQNL